MKTYWFIFCQDQILLEIKNNNEYGIPCQEASPVLLEPWNKPFELPNIHNCLCKAISIDSPFIDEKYINVTLRASYEYLSFEEYSMAGKARELLYWDSCTKFCGVCGGPTKRKTAISKRCTNCGKEFWPSPATAIIVLVSKQDEVLLVQSNKFKKDYYGLVAGFLETGETLEECVKREVKEETGVEIEDIKYQSSQSWPFPFGIMAAFTAKYKSGDIKLQHSELNKGGWFNYKTLPNLPPCDSVARKMINSWYEQKNNGK